jgi:hypothetical protein
MSMNRTSAFKEASRAYKLKLPKHRAEHTQILGGLGWHHKRLGPDARLASNAVLLSSSLFSTAIVEFAAPILYC